MTMPKKGTRNINVKGNNYKYKITSKKQNSFFDEVLETKLVIELGINNYYQEKREGFWKVTPKEVRETVLRELNNG